MKKNLGFLMVLLLSTACTNTPKSIVYGSDGCHFCSMTIVDKQHAAQFMTKKGRTYSFDASECMLNHLKEIDASTIAQLLVNDYNAPGETIDATKATYLISKNIPSPMGEFLTAFATAEEAKYAQEGSQGELLTWNELVQRFNR
ncbi:nitrous oxide reductase accessory protein NosL [Maribacter sp. 2210JD10-5]|uniref:nitrous oxide reductase accessory protein NosL n=1 Tax=Maribacter sp. 2210JD10-5 TaxID=3386272 RepID=UPI0039BD1CBC